MAEYQPPATMARAGGSRRAQPITPSVVPDDQMLGEVIETVCVAATLVVADAIGEARLGVEHLVAQPLCVGDVVRMSDSSTRSGPRTAVRFVWARTTIRRSLGS